MGVERRSKLRQITSSQLAAYQNERSDQGRAPKTINGELSVLRQVLKRARLWYRFVDDYVTLRNQKPPVGTALASNEQRRLFEMARTRPAWLYAYVATTLSFYCGLRACEIRSLRWRDIDLENALLHVRRSKTPAEWRSPTLNATCLYVVRYLHDQAIKLRFTEPDHFVFPWHGRNKRLDPTRGMTSWRTAWRNIRRAAGLPHVRFHDGRHTAIARPTATDTAFACGRRREKNSYVTIHVTKADFARTTARFSEEKWLTSLDDFRNWLIRESCFSNGTGHIKPLGAVATRR